jgi:hypothetical protein
VRWAIFIALGSGCFAPGVAAPVDTRPLGVCIVGWWKTTSGNCSIDPTCEGPASEDIEDACGGADCGAYVALGFLSDGGYVQAWVIDSADRNKLCTLDVINGTWTATDDEITVSLTTLSDELSADCARNDATINDVPRERIGDRAAEILGSRAEQDTWSDCTR